MKGVRSGGNANTKQNTNLYCKVNSSLCKKSIAVMSTWGILTLAISISFALYL